MNEWADFDVFQNQKQAAFRESDKSIRELANQLQSASLDTPRDCQRKFLLASLWGNQVSLTFS